jgi:hypothetical protein
MTDVLTQADLFALYGGFAGVAAITTALQAAVALSPLSQFDDVSRRKRTNAPGTQAHNDARGDAGTYLRAAWLLNIGATTVNFAVLASWGYLVFALLHRPHWYLWLPFAAVTLAAIYLLVAAAVGIGRLCDARK